MYVTKILTFLKNIDLTYKGAKYMDSKDIAIIGIGGRFPKSPTLEHYWELIQNKLNGITYFNFTQTDNKINSKQKLVNARGILGDIDKFDAEFFNISPTEAASLDPQHRIFLEVVWEALENAGYNPLNYEGTISLYAGCSPSKYNPIESDSKQTASTTLQNYINNAPEFLATRVGHKLNLRGECISVGTACSSSLVSVHMACQSLLNQSSDIAIAGGVSINVPEFKGYIYQEGLIYSSNGECKPFDAEATGTVEGNGAGVVVLKKLENAIRDKDFIHAVIKGSAVNNDGSDKASYTAPSQLGQTKVILSALEKSKIDPRTISYVETHGTGTILGDPIEMEALKSAYQLYTSDKNYCAIGSVKSNIGHLTHAAGIAGLIKLVLCLKNKIIPSQFNFSKPNPYIDFKNSPFYVPQESLVWRDTELSSRRGAVSSFGFGGTNAHLIVEEAPDIEKEKSHIQNAQLVTLSARTNEQLIQIKKHLKEYLIQNKNLNLADISYTLNVGRKAFKYRWATITSNIEELINHLDRSDIQEPSNINQHDEILNLFLHKWIDGKNIDWDQLYKMKKYYKIPLPSYPFERVSYWKGEQALDVEQQSKDEIDPCTSCSSSCDKEDAFFDLEKKIIKILERLLGVSGLKRSDDFYAVGGDSIALIDFLVEIEEETEGQIFLTSEETFDINTIGDLCDLCFTKYSRE